MDVSLGLHRRCKGLPSPHCRWSDGSDGDRAFLASAAQMGRWTRALRPRVAAPGCREPHPRAHPLSERPHSGRSDRCPAEAVALGGAPLPPPTPPPGQSRGWETSPGANGHGCRSDGAGDSVSLPSHSLRDRSAGLNRDGCAEARGRPPAEVSWVPSHLHPFLGPPCPRGGLEGLGTDGGAGTGFTHRPLTASGLLGQKPR